MRFAISGVMFAVVMMASTSGFTQDRGRVCLPELGHTTIGTDRMRNAEASLQKARDSFELFFNRMSATLPPAAENRQPSLEQLKSLISAYVKTIPKSAFVMYSGDDDYLCAFLWTAETVRKAPAFRYVRLRHNRGTLKRLSDQLRSGIGIHIGGSRTLKLRALIALAKPKSASPSLEQMKLARRRLSELFFPKAFHNSLRGIRNVTMLTIRGMAEVPVSYLDPFGDGRPAIEAFSLNFVAFPSELHNRPQAWRPAFRAPLIIGNPISSADPDWKFSDLPGAAMEARLAAERFGGRALIGRDATKEAFVAAVGTADYIHIAAHAISDPKSPKENGFIRFTDGRLTVSKAQNLKLRKIAPLVVLSACQTATGRVEEAGIVGMGRAFQAAGARNTVMSLWNINDTATLFLMKQFMASIQSHPPSNALRIAMLATRARYPEPRDWASFNVFGLQSAH